MSVFFKFKRKKYNMAISDLNKKLYSKKLESKLRSVGLYEKITYLYWALIRKIEGNDFEADISGTKVLFETSSARDYQSIKHKVDSERPVLSDMVENLEENDVFYDIGAQNGLFSILAAKKIENGACIAFEPFPKNIEMLEKNVKLNDVELEAKEVALSNQDGEVEYTFSSDDRSLTNGTITGRSDADNTVNVDVRAGDSLVSESGLPEPTVLKIDVEGEEYNVLKGLEKFIEDNVQLIYLELHTSMLDDKEVEDVYSFLEERGFEIETLYSRNNKGIKAVKNSRED